MASVTPNATSADTAREQGCAVGQRATPRYDAQRLVPRRKLVDISGVRWPGTGQQRGCDFALVAPHQLEQDLDFNGVGCATRRCHMVVAESCGSVGDVGPLSFAMLTDLDGSASLGVLIAAVVDEADDVDQDLIDATLLNVRDLASIGMLELVGR